MCRCSQPCPCVMRGYLWRWRHGGCGPFSCFIREACGFSCLEWGRGASLTAWEKRGGKVTEVKADRTTGGPAEPNETDLLGKCLQSIIEQRWAQKMQGFAVEERVLFVNRENLSQVQSMSFEIHTDLDSNYGAAAASCCITLDKEIDVSELHHPCLENGAKIALMSWGWGKINAVEIRADSLGF